MRRLKKHNKQGRKNSKTVLSAVLLGLAVIVVSFLWVANKEVDKNERTEKVETSNVSASNDLVDEQITSSTENDETKELFEPKVLQNVLDNWEKSASGTASVVLMDVNGNMVASINEDRNYFAASIYKLYVAYEGYRQLDEGAVDGSEQYVNGNTRIQCLDLMIRESDSPCAEKLWIEIGKTALNEKLKDYGIDNTSMVNITTTAYDSALMLSMIARGEGLNTETQLLLLESMENQIYRDALNAGFSSDVLVYNKIGFNGFVEYHDTAIVKFDDDRQLIISALTENVGTKSIASLAAAIEAAVAEN